MLIRNAFVVWGPLQWMFAVGHRSVQATELAPDQVITHIIPCVMRSMVVDNPNGRKERDN